MSDPTKKEFYLRCFSTPLPNPPQGSQEMRCEVEYVTNNQHDLTTKELLEYQQDPKTHHIITTLMKSNPTQYMLALAKEGAKLPSKFYLNTLKEKTLGNVAQCSKCCSIYY